MRTNLFMFLNGYNKHKNNYYIIIIFLNNMNNCHMMNHYKQVILNQNINSFINLDDFQDDKYIYYQCFVDDKRKFCFYETCPNKQDISNNMITEVPRSLLVKINKNIPQFIHKAILYFYFIPKY